MKETGQISSKDCVYFPSYLVKCICFMLGHLMMPWNLKTKNSKIWFSSEQKELLKWNKKTLFLVWQELSLRLKKQTSKNVADITFNYANLIWAQISHAIQWIIILQKKPSE